MTGAPVVWIAAGRVAQGGLRASRRRGPRSPGTPYASSARAIAAGPQLPLRLSVPRLPLADPAGDLALACVAECRTRPWMGQDHLDPGRRRTSPCRPARRRPPRDRRAGRRRPARGPAPASASAVGRVSRSGRVRRARDRSMAAASARRSASGSGWPAARSRGPWPASGGPGPGRPGSARPASRTRLQRSPAPSAFVAMASGAEARPRPSTDGHHEQDDGWREAAGARRIAGSRVQDARARSSCDGRWPTSARRAGRVGHARRPAAHRPRPGRPSFAGDRHGAPLALGLEPDVDESTVGRVEPGGLGRACPSRAAVRSVPGASQRLRRRGLDEVAPDVLGRRARSSSATLTW